MHQYLQRAAPPRGFSLIELLVVIGILAVIAAIVAPNLLGKADDANVNAAKIQIDNISNTIGLYRMETGKYPEALSELVTKPADSPRWKGPYLKESLLKDPWHNEIQYAYPGEHGKFDVYSYGSDGTPGGDGNDADIGTWE